MWSKSQKLSTVINKQLTLFTYTVSSKISLNVLKPTFNAKVENEWSNSVIFCKYFFILEDDFYEFC